MKVEVINIRIDYLFENGCEGRSFLELEEDELDELPQLTRKAISEEMIRMEEYEEEYR
jgi:hypothetical protein